MQNFSSVSQFVNMQCGTLPVAPYCKMFDEKVVLQCGVVSVGFLAHGTNSEVRHLAQKERFPK